jgi:hypothetical protein
VDKLTESFPKPIAKFLEKALDGSVLIDSKLITGHQRRKLNEYSKNTGKFKVENMIRITGNKSVKTQTRKYNRLTLFYCFFDVLLISYLYPITLLITDLTR